MLNRSFLTLILSVFIASAVHAHFAPQVSEYFITENAEFEIDAENQIIEYDVTLRARKPLPKGSLIRVEFQNPIKRGGEIVREVEVVDDSRVFRFRSGNIVGLKLKKDYSISVTFYASAAKQTILGKHGQRLFFEVPKKKYKKEVRRWYEKQEGEEVSPERSEPETPKRRSLRGRDAQS